MLKIASKIREKRKIFIINLYFIILIRKKKKYVKRNLAHNANKIIIYSVKRNVYVTTSIDTKDTSHEINTKEYVNKLQSTLYQSFSSSYIVR